MTPFGLVLNKNEFQRLCLTTSDTTKCYLNVNKRFFVLPLVQSLVVESQISPL